MSDKNLFQACRYQAQKASDWRPGIAKLNVGFGTSDIKWIVDAETGERMVEVWDYHLRNGALAHMTMADPEEV